MKYRMLSLFFATLMVPGLRSNSSDTPMMVSPACAQRLLEIRKDGGALLTYYRTVFTTLAENTHRFDAARLRPSTVIKEVTPRLELEGLFTRTSPGAYMHAILEPHWAAFDRVFAEHLIETKDAAATWLWFIDYFEEQGMKLLWKQYMIQFIEDNVRWCRPKRTHRSGEGNLLSVDML